LNNDWNEKAIDNTPVMQDKYLILKKEEKKE
jgi:hypothetical protein